MPSSATTPQAGGRRTDDASRLTPSCQTLLTHHGPADCGSCVACGMLWCSVAQRCFCAPDFTCDGKLTQAEHPLQYKYNEQMAGWCPDAWSGGCRSLDMCQHRASSGCDTCLAASTTTCAWCLYSDAAGSAASTCVYAGDNSAHFTNCNDRRMTCPEEVEAYGSSGGLFEQILLIALGVVLAACSSLIVMACHERRRRRPTPGSNPGPADICWPPRQLRSCLRPPHRHRPAPRRGAPLAAAGGHRPETAGAHPTGATPATSSPRARLEPKVAFLASSRQASQMGELTGAGGEGDEEEGLRRRQQQELQRQALTIALELLPTSDVGATAAGGAKGSEEAVCPICLEGFEEDRLCSTLPCAHPFHRACLEPWVLSGRAAGGDCPLCKEPILQGALGTQVQVVLGEELGQQVDARLGEAAAGPPPPAQQAGTEAARADPDEPPDREAVQRRLDTLMVDVRRERSAGRQEELVHPTATRGEWPQWLRGDPLTLRENSPEHAWRTRRQRGSSSP
eukprot:Transcript_30792.p1 GENE.Transcript_30792~~Transcript_30792.p1  ORF type:complete len:509 (+),score=76.16 Transcript_30792:148-1674(+)